MGIIEIILDKEYFDKLIEIRSMVDSEIGLTLNQLSIVYFNNIEVIGLILGILALITYTSFTTFVVIWTLAGPYIVYRTLRLNSRQEGLGLHLASRKIRDKIKPNHELEIDIPRRYLTFPDIALLTQKIRMIRFNKNTENEIEKTNKFLWANAFSMNAFNNQVGFWAIYISVGVFYLFCVFQNLIQFNILLFIFGVIHVFAFFYVFSLEGNLEFYVLHDFKRSFLIVHIIWILSLIGLYGVLVYSSFQMIFQVLSIHNLLLVLLVGLIEYFTIMIINDFFASGIMSGIVNDKLQTLIKLKKNLDFQIYKRDRLEENPDIYLYDYLVTKRYKPIKWKFAIFGKYVLEPDLTSEDIQLLANSPLHFEILQGEVGMKGLTITNKEILRRYGYED